MNVRRSLPLLIVAAAFQLTGATSAFAGDFYLGFAATMESFDADYGQTTVNGPRSPRGAGNFHSDDSDDETTHGLGAFVGYRMPLGDNGIYLNAEVDFTHHGGTLRGVAAEEGNAPGRNEYGESWGENWSYEKERSYGLTFQLGMPLEAMSDASVYALAGVRRSETRLHLSFSGCGTAAPCNDAGLVPGTFSRDATVTGWTAGVGFEKRLGEHTAFRSELRYTDYETDRWVSVPLGPDGASPDPDVLRVPASVDSDEVGVSFGLVRYF